jgi:hypothetical protein
MRVRFVTALLLMSVMSAAPAWANGNWNGSASTAAPAASNKPKAFNVTIKMLESGSSSPGACTVGLVGYDDYCATGSCTCYTYSGTATGATGKGPVQFSETYDYGTQYGFTNYGCASAYGEIDILGSKDQVAIAFVGSDCGSDFAAPYLTGGCMLGQDTIGASVAGQCSGTYSTGTYTTFKIKAKGLK